MRKHNILYFDLETTSSDKPQVYSWGCMDSNGEYNYGITGESLIEFFLSQDKDTTAYAHNGAKFDAHFIKDLLTKMGYKQKIFESKILETILESDYKNIRLDEHYLMNEKKPSPLLEPGEYSLLVDGNFKIMEIKIGLKSYKFTNGKKKYRALRIRDSNLLFMGSIKSYGETLNKHYNTDIYSKGEGESGITYTRDTLYESILEWKKDGNEFEYQKQDCFILKSYLELMMEKLPFNKWKLTSASTAYSQWVDMLGESIQEELEKLNRVNRYYPNPKTKSYYRLQWTGKKDSMSTKKFREQQVKPLINADWLDDKDEYGTYLFNRLYKYYRGGLTHMHPQKVGLLLDNINVADIVSSYPSVMNSDRLFPIGTPVEGDGGKDYPLKLYKLEMLSTVKNKKGLPFLPVLNDKNLSYEYRSVLEKHTTFYVTDNELKNFKKYYSGKYKASIEFSFRAMSGKKLFGKYIDHYFKMKSDAKESGDQGQSIISKLFLNSLYGKFATKSVRTTRVWNDREIDWEKESNIINSKFYLPIAIWITAYAREKLVIGVDENYDYYLGGDTDSIFYIGDVISKNLQFSKELGDWELEYENLSGVVVRPKQYAFFSDKGKPKVGLAGINLYRVDIDEEDKTYLETLTPMHMIEGRTIHNQLKPKRHLGFGIQLEDTVKEIKPIWDKPPLFNQWFKNSDEYIKLYETQREKILKKIEKNI